MKKKGYAKFGGGGGGGNKVYYGRCASAVWAMGSCRGVKQRKRKDVGLYKLSQGKEKIE